MSSSYVPNMEKVCKYVYNVWNLQALDWRVLDDVGIKSACHLMMYLWYSNESAKVQFRWSRQNDTVNHSILFSLISPW